MLENENTTTNWERQLLEKVVMASVTEQRRARRWKIFTRFTILAVFIAVVMGSCTDFGTKPLVAHTALITIDGVIDSENNNAKMINESLVKAFEDEQAQGIVLALNSPGGSPVQSGEVFDEIERLRVLHPNKKVYAVISDVCASGCYYIAAGADKIYANQASLVGSIGVLFDGFGFVDTLNKVGVERRLYTAGEHKGFLDPFSAEQPQDVAFLKTMLDDVHQQFIAAVEKGRGDRLKPNDLLYSGYAWTGKQSVAMGLVDDLGSVDYVAREIIGAKTLVDYTTKPDVFEQFSHKFAASIMSAFKEEVEIKGLY